MIALQGVTLVATLITGLQVALSDKPLWPFFKVSVATLLCSLILTVIALGREFRWWNFHGQVLDQLSIIWLGVTLLVAALTYWLAR